MLTIPDNRHNPLGVLPLILFLVLVSGFPLFSTSSHGLTTNDPSGGSWDVPATSRSQSPVNQPDIIGATLSRAEYNLKRGDWQEAAQQAQFVVSKDKENVKAHAILGLIAALGGQQEQAERTLALLHSHKASGLYPALIAAVLDGQKKQFQQARSHLATALQQEPDHPIALYVAGSLDLAQENWIQAEQAFLAVVRSSPEFAPALAGLGQAYWNLKQTEQAVAAYQKAIAAEPDTLLYRQQLIVLYKATGQKDAENKAATEMLYFVPGVKERSLEQAMDLLNRGEYDQAIKRADTLMGIYKKFPVSHYIKAAALINKGDAEAARKSIADLLAAGPRTVKAHHEAGLCYLALGDLDKAEEQFKLALALEPDNGRTFVFLPIIEQLRGHRDRALNGLAVMLAQNEPPALIHYLQANNYLAEGKSFDFQQSMKQGVGLVPGLKEGTPGISPASNRQGEIADNRNLMVLYFFNGWYEQAVRKSTLLLKANASDPFALWYNALAKISQKRYADAIASLKQLLALDPNLSAVHMQLGQAYVQTGDKDQALKSFAKVTETSPEPYAAYMAMGNVYWQRGADAEAAQSYRKAIEIRPESSHAYPPLAVILAEQPGTVEESGRLAEKAVALAPKDPSALDALGWANIHQQNLQVGIEKLEQARELAPRDPLILYHLGVGYYRMNQSDKAKQWLSAALGVTREFRGSKQAQEILNTLK